MTVTLASFPWCIIRTSAAALLLISAPLFNLGAHASIVMVMVRICGRMSSTTLSCSSVMLDRGRGCARVISCSAMRALSLNPSSFLSSCLLFIVFSLTYSFGHRGGDRRENAGEGFWQSAMSPLCFSQPLHLPSFLRHPTHRDCIALVLSPFLVFIALSLPLSVMNLKYVFVLVLFSKLASIGDVLLVL